MTSTNILGVHVSTLPMAQTLETIEGWIGRGKRHYVCVSNVHSIMESWDDAALRHIHNEAGLVTPDGMPLVWTSHRRGFTQAERVYGPDLMLALCERGVAQSYRHFLYGGAEGVADQLKTRLETQFPGIQIVGTYTPPFRPLTPAEDADMVSQINAVQPDIVWVGLGMPRQEQWMHTHVNQLNANALIGVGAAFDFHTGRKPQAPRWMQRAGLEWAFRLATEPRRLWKRYLHHNPRFVGLMLLDTLGLLRLPDEEAVLA